MPHITTAGNGFTTEILLANNGSEPSLYTLYPVTIDGENLSTVTGTLNANETVFSATETLFGPETVSHFRYEGNQNLGVTVVYRANRETAGPTHVQGKTQTAQEWRIYPGNPDLTWDGIAIVNRGIDKTTIRVSQLDATGVLLGEETIATDLDPKNKALFVLSERFPTVPNSYYKISATQPTAIISLRGDLDSNYLWENLAIPIMD